MIIFSIIYSICIILSFSWWLYIYKKSKNLFWKVFLLFTFLLGIWMLWYYLFWSWINNLELLKYISRICFTLWLFLSYILMFWLYFLKKDVKNIKKRYIFLLISIFVITFSYFVFTDSIIKEIYYNWNIWLYREIYWEKIEIYLYLQVIFVIWFIILWFINWKNTSKITIQRTKYIIVLSYLLIAIWVVLQVILPYFNIWYLEKYIIFFYIVYILLIIIVINRYYYWEIWYGVWRIIIILFSLSTSIFIYYYVISNNFLLNNWYSSSLTNNYFINHSILILIFFISYNYLNKLLIWHSSKIETKKNIENIEYKISQINDFEKINSILDLNINKIFKNNFSRIVKITKNTKWNSLLKKVFEEENYKLIINDEVYYEENNLDKEILKESINDKIYLVFPIFDENWKLQGYLWIWNKTFWEFYTKFEIEALKKFSFFLENHLKYIKNYQKLKNLTYNLDKEVDRKTIEYNRLINKQKEYISVISHEIKSPVSSAIFQADFIKDEVNKINDEDLKKEVWILNDVLLRIWELTNTLFSSEYFENSEVNLYKEKINISNLVFEEFEYYKSINSNIKFIHNIDENIWYVKIDKIQFKQVLQNLITNAIKFVPQKNWIIFISLYKQNDDIIILIEDNWIWLAWVNTKKIFDRYTSTKENNIWLWLWLYLCKKIIWLHKWEITASKSKSLWWARFKIKLNKKTLG